MKFGLIEVVSKLGFDGIFEIPASFLGIGGSNLFNLSFMMMIKWCLESVGQEY